MDLCQDDNSLYDTAPIQQDLQQDSGLDYPDALAEHQRSLDSLSTFSQEQLDAGQLYDPQQPHGHHGSQNISVEEADENRQVSHPDTVSTKSKESFPKAKTGDKTRLLEELYQRMTLAISKQVSSIESIAAFGRTKVHGLRSWEFLVRLLAYSRTNPSLIRWEDEAQGTFRMIQPALIAKLWGVRTGKPRMSYHSFAEDLSRHYGKGGLIAVSEKQLLFGCGPKALKLLKELSQNQE